MSGGIEHSIRQLAPDGLRIHIWACQGGHYQINVSEAGSGSWTVHHDDDPVLGLSEALRQRACGVASRVVSARDNYADAPRVEPATTVQIDLEDAIAAMPADDFEDLL